MNRECARFARSIIVNYAYSSSQNNYSTFGIIETLKFHEDNAMHACNLVYPYIPTGSGGYRNYLVRMLPYL